MQYSIILFMLSFASIISLISLNGLSAYGVFTLNSEEESSSGNVAKIILTSQKYKSDRFSDEIVGQVKNVGNGTAEWVKIFFTLYNKKGEIIGSEHTYADQKTLKPGQKSAFNVHVDEKTGDKVKAFEVSLSWDNPDGTEEYIENIDVEDENNYIVSQSKEPTKLTEEEIEKLGLFER
jgi:hypothetical protein